ncbi:cell envelope integrity protein TolA [Luteolibacter sp. AS25]|uniref:cell envelope integrity protein TolA n=1 Tax=Luteolibacter sp. AS25 TaxID=3135776 RepID=UPI00398A780B
MKTPFISLFYCCLLAQPLFAETPESVETHRQTALGSEMPQFQRADGRIFNDVRITAIDDGGISIRHASGTARLRYADLTSAQRELYGISKSDAQATYQQENERRAAYERAVDIKEEERALRTELEAEELRKEALIAEKEAIENAKSAPVEEKTTSTIPEFPKLDASSAIGSRIYKTYHYNRSPYRYSYFPYSGYYRPSYFRSTSYPRNIRYYGSHYYRRQHSSSIRLAFP